MRTTERPKVVVGDPGYALGLAGFITSFFVGLVGLVLSAIALTQSRRAGKRNGFAVAGIIVGAIQILLGILLAVAIGIAVVSAVTYCRNNPDARGCSEQGGQYSMPYDDPRDVRTF